MKNSRLIYLLIIILVIWNVVLTGIFIKNSKNVSSEEQIINVVEGFSTDLTEVYSKCKASVVTVETDKTSLSGIVYSKQENLIYILTCYHGITDANIIKVYLASGQSFDATLKGKDALLDLAVLEINADLEINNVAITDSNSLKAGEYVLTIGSPTSKEFSSSAVVGIVSDPLRTITNRLKVDKDFYEYYINLIQLDADVKEGYSGSPVYNMEGSLCGIVTMKNDTATFALPINEIKVVVEKIINNEEYIKTDFGIKGQFVDSLENYERNNLNIPLDINSGYYVSNVMLSSLGNSIGIKNGDVILDINKQKINNYNDLLNVQYLNLNEFEVTVNRNNEDIILVGSLSD